jgi:hypothetical protein
MQEAAAREAAFTVAEAAAIAAPTDDRVIEGKVVRKTTRRRGAAKAKPVPRTTGTKPASRKRRSGKSPAPETTA